MSLLPKELLDTVVKQTIANHLHLEEGKEVTTGEAGYRTSLLAGRPVVIGGQSKMQQVGVVVYEGPDKDHAISANHALNAFLTLYSEILLQNVADAIGGQMKAAQQSILGPDGRPLNKGKPPLDLGKWRNRLKGKQ